MPFPVSESLILAVEQQLGRRLPEPMRARLARDNGGEIAAGAGIWSLHPVADPSDRKRLARTCNHLIQETAQARDWPRFPYQAIAIASNGSGDLLILLPDADQVNFWDHETGKHRPVRVAWR